METETAIGNLHLEQKKQLEAVLALRDEVARLKPHPLLRGLKRLSYRQAAEDLRFIVPGLVVQDPAAEDGWRVNDAEIQKQMDRRFEAARRAFYRAKPCYEHLVRNAESLAQQYNELLEREAALTEAVGDSELPSATKNPANRRPAGRRAQQAP